MHSLSLVSQKRNKSHVYCSIRLQRKHDLHRKTILHMYIVLYLIHWYIGFYLFYKMYILFSTG